MLTNPPIIVLLKVADANTARTRGNRKLVLLWGPADKCRSTVNTQENQSRLPMVGGAVEGPDIGISVLGAGDDAVGPGGPVDRGDGLVVLSQGRGLCPAGAGLAEDGDHVRVEADSQLYFDVLVVGVSVEVVLDVEGSIEHESNDIN